MQQTFKILCGTKSSGALIFVSPSQNFLLQFSALWLVSARQVIAGRMLQEDKKTRGHNLVPRDNIDFSRRPCYRVGTQSILPLDSVAPGV
jgi:hypothetical protein